MRTAIYNTCLLVAICGAFGWLLLTIQAFFDRMRVRRNMGRYGVKK